MSLQLFFEHQNRFKMCRRQNDSLHKHVAGSTTRSKSIFEMEDVADIKYLVSTTSLFH